MNKGIIFAGGVVAGAAIGSAVTYFALVKKIKAECDAEIERYAEHCEERISRLTEDEEEEDISDEDEDPEEPVNEGVKKYHQYPGDGYNAIFERKPFGKEEEALKKEVKNNIAESVKKFDQEINDRNPGVFEITEQQYEESSYSHEELDYEFVDEDDHPGILTMLGSDEIAEKHYNLKREQLISEVWRWAPDYVDEKTGVGEFYIQNDILNKVFKVNVIMPDEDGTI